MTIYWPSDLQDAVVSVLPFAAREGYGYQARSPVSETDFGLLTRRRRIHQDTPAVFTITLELEDTEWDYFDGFYWHELNAGTEWFVMPLLVRGVIEQVEVMFLEAPPDYALRGVNGTSFSMRLITRKSLAPSAAAFGGFWTDDTLFIG